MSDIDLTKMTKTQLVAHGESVGIILDSKLTKAVMIEALSVPSIDPAEKRRNDAFAMLLRLVKEAEMEL